MDAVAERTDASVVDPKKKLVTWKDLARLMGQPYKLVLVWKAEGAPEVHGKTCVDWVQTWLDNQARAVKPANH
jgi:hypothetical protein